ncbi:hypothetical protein Z968_07265 [Clostridium novyi A str. 4552]|uniref:Gram-positive cocci surface proteins LPxTG domain-containing protein n=1 Tax=Clostridium novyi A str. 4552 TaxID=1444289 RepID=A0A0A0I7C0_CLONO|nr:LPXTG cell wall anchor domain-containing protein [Clostridium novyi]KGM96186.1 hypothetical protein Z968_07265 [Clostridium novyi A str. 4552]
MLKNKKIITTTVAGLTLVGNMVITPNCFADTVENKAPKNIQDSVKKENKIKRKKRHKGHNKNKKQLVEDKFDIIKAPIRGIDFDDNINVEEEVISNLDGQPIEEKVKETPVNLTNTYLEGNEIPEKLPEVNPYEFDIIKAPRKEKDVNDNKEKEKENIKSIDMNVEPISSLDGQPVEEIVNPEFNTYLEGKEIPEKLSEVDPFDFEIIKAPIRGIDFDNNINVEEEPIINIDGQPVEEMVNPEFNTYLDGKEIPEKLSEVDAFDFEIIKAPIRGIYTDNNISTEKLVSPPANTYLGEKEIEESNKEKLNQPLEKEELNEKLHEEKSIDDLKSEGLQEESTKKIGLNSMQNKQVEQLNVKDKSKENKENKINEKNNNIELPKTATNNFTNILLGGILFMAGIAMSLFSKKRLHNK